MDIIRNNILLTQEQLINFGATLVLALLAGLFIALIYKVTHRHLNYESTFLSTQVILVPVVATVMLFVRGNLVVSLGLVGSMSIIRFRTPIKDTRDMVFLFWAIITGLGLGTLNWTVTGMALIAIALILVLMDIMKYGRKTHCEYVLVINCTGRMPHEKIEEIIGRFKVIFKLRNYEMEGEKCELIYELRFPSEKDYRAREIMEHIRLVPGVDKLSLLSPQLTLPM